MWPVAKPDQKFRCGGFLLDMVTYTSPFSSYHVHHYFIYFTKTSTRNYINQLVAYCVQKTIGDLSIEVERHITTIT